MSGLTRQTSVAVKMATAADRRQAERAEDARRQRELYGKHVDAVLLLRRRGYVISRTGKDVRVDNKVMSLAELGEMAKRVAKGRPPSAAPSASSAIRTASGLKVGDSVALKPKVAPAAPPPRAASPRPPKERKLSGAAATAAEKAREHSADLGTKPRVVWLDLGLLDVDRRYQREISKEGGHHINRIVRAFNWNCYQPIVVTEGADGRYAVIDGQHRLEAARKHPLIDSLPCYIIDAPDTAAQAAVFIAVNSNRVALTSLQKFWAAHAAGDTDCIEIAKACAAAGVVILRSVPSGNTGPLEIRAPIKLKKLHRRFGRAAIETALKMLATAHPATVNAFRAPTVAALVAIAAAGALSVNRMTSVLSAMNLGELYADAQRDRAASGATLEAATERLLRAAYGAGPNGVRVKDRVDGRA